MSEQDATKTAITAGYAERSAAVIASKLMDDLRVQRRIAEMN